MDRRSFLRLAAAAAVPKPAERPNIVLILADDIGYGDLGCYGATRIATPNLDRLARGGVRFTDAHSSSATCTPSRYALMTGEYPWRKAGTGILPGDANLIIDRSRATLPSLLQRAGYTTGCVGKWHLGLGDGPVDWNGEIRPGPLEIGFDSSFIIPATGDRVPCVYVENHRVANLDPKDPIRVSYHGKTGTEPTGLEHPELLRMKASHGHNNTIVNGIGRIGYMSGGKSARWVDEDIASTLTGKATAFIEQSRRKPFFLYLATHDIHVPRVPAERFLGTTGCGRRCEAIAELDWTVGKVMAELDRHGLTRDTLFIFTSDNGPVVDDGYQDGSVEAQSGHRPSGPFRGGKYTIYEGGTRLPMITRWPARIKPGVVSGALVSQVDLAASIAELAGQKLAEGDAPDSFNVLPALLGEATSARSHLVEHANRLALRDGGWKVIPDKDKPELYNLTGDPAETRNLAGAETTRFEAMSVRLEQIRAAGRSRN